MIKYQLRRFVGKLLGRAPAIEGINAGVRRILEYHDVPVPPRMTAPLSSKVLPTTKGFTS